MVWPCYQRRLLRRKNNALILLRVAPVAAWLSYQADNAVGATRNKIKALCLRRSNRL